MQNLKTIRDHFPYGTVLKIQREFGLAEIYDRLKSIRETGMDYVVIWPAVYWWEDSKNPDYPFATGKSILNYAYEIGLHVVMELAGQISCLEYTPDFVMKRDYLAVNRDGTYNNSGASFGFINYNHPDVKNIIKRNFYNTALAYKDYPALYGYDIWNETMFWSYDLYTLQVFRDWLEEKYKTIENLNAIWERSYCDFSQVEFPYWRWASIANAADLLDFQKDNIGMIIREWAGHIRSVDAKHPIQADNIASEAARGELISRSQDNWELSRSVDEMGISLYPQNNKGDREKHSLRWQIFSSVYSAAHHEPYWIAEMQSHHQTLLNTQGVVYPNELKWWNWEAITHGAKGIIYWKWEPFIKGHQLFGRGLVDQKGRETPRLSEAKKIKSILNKHPEIMSFSPEKAKAAILYDRQNFNYQKAFTQTYKGVVSDNIYVEAIKGLYQCLWQNNIDVDFVTPDDVANRRVREYNVIFATYQMCMPDDLAKGLEEFVINGGTVVADGMFGIFNENGIMHRELPGGKLRTITGIDFHDVDISNLTFSIEGGIECRGYIQKQLFDLEGAEVIARFEDGLPAITSSSAGRGNFVFIGTSYWYGCFLNNCGKGSEVIAFLDKKYGISTHRINDNSVKYAIMTGDGGTRLLALFNYTNEDKDVSIIIEGVDEGSYTVENLYTGIIDIVSESNGILKLDRAISSKDTAVFVINRSN